LKSRQTLATPRITKHALLKYEYAMSTNVTKHRHVAAECDTVAVVFNYRENKKASIPDELRQRILDVEKTIS